ANSDTIIASSTSMPTAKISENSTTMLTVNPASCSPSTPARKDAGIAMPMNSEARKPSTNKITIATSSTPVATEFCRSPSICRMIFDLSWVKVTCTASGQVFCSAAKVGRKHPGGLLDRILGGAGDAQQRALGDIAGEAHHQHRVKRKVDLQHLRLVDVARQVVLGLIDLGTHVGQRRFGIEPGLELEQHKTAALERG